MFNFLIMPLIKLILRRFLLLYSIAVIFYVEVYLGIILKGGNSLAVPPKIMHGASYIYVIFSTPIFAISTLALTFNFYQLLRYKKRSTSSIIEWMIVILISGYVMMESSIF